MSSNIGEQGGPSKPICEFQLVAVDPNTVKDAQPGPDPVNEAAATMEKLLFELTHKKDNDVEDDDFYIVYDSTQGARPTEDPPIQLSKGVKAGEVSVITKRVEVGGHPGVSPRDNQEARAYTSGSGSAQVQTQDQVEDGMDADK